MMPRPGCVPYTWATEWCQRRPRWSRHCRAGLKNRRQTPLWVRTRHLPTACRPRAKPPRSGPPGPQQRRSTQSPAGAARPGPRSHTGMPGCIVHGNPALRNPARADAPDQPVADARNQPDSHRQRRTERLLAWPPSWPAAAVRDGSRSAVPGGTTTVTSGTRGKHDRDAQRGVSQQPQLAESDAGLNKMGVTPGSRTWRRHECRGRFITRNAP
jgi:hypothetical protein